ncbi:MAG: tetratricopeptide repeat protein [Thermodesulfobacteriota bacterium]
MNVRTPAEPSGNEVLTAALKEPEASGLDPAGIPDRRVQEIHLRGLLAAEKDNLDTAAELMALSLELCPDEPAFHCNFGRVLSRLGRKREAQACFLNALELAPDFGLAHYNLGLEYVSQGRIIEATACFRRAVVAQPEFMEARYRLGLGYLALGRREEAAECFQEVLRKNPDRLETCFLLAETLSADGRYDEAIACLSNSLRFNPDNAEVHHRLGLLLEVVGRTGEAVAWYERAIILDPGRISSLHNLGWAWQKMGRPDKAVACYRKVLERRPESTLTHHNLGNALDSLGRREEALRSYREALRLDPNLTDSRCSLIFALREEGNWAEADQLAAVYTHPASVSENHQPDQLETPFLSLILHQDPERNLAAARRHSLQIQRQADLSTVKFSFDSYRRNKDRIALGYLSGDFRDHVIGHQALGLFKRHDRRNFLVLGYSYGRDDGSLFRRDIDAECDRFIDLVGRSDLEAARRINEDEVDILVDLTGYTGDCRPGIAALRPAPVQAAYLGFLGTTGSSFLDYIITDRVVTPEEESGYYTEKFVYLPHGYQVSDFTGMSSHKQYKRSDFGLPENAFVYCSFNGGYKIEPIIFQVWMSILLQVQKGILWLFRCHPTLEKTLKVEAEKRGVDPARLVFADRWPLSDHLHRLDMADLGLDTRVYNGGATTGNALWAGVPVLTLTGSHYVSRMSESHLSVLGLSDLVASNLEEYESLAVRMALNPESLADTRRKLRQAKTTSPLFDSSRFVRHLETAYKMMWANFTAGNEARLIEVPV